MRNLSIISVPPPFKLKETSQNLSIQILNFLRMPFVSSFNLP